jgi:exonuclease SbcC
MLSTKEKQLGKTRDEISTKLKMALVAKTTLDNHAIHRPEQLDILRTQVATQRAQIQKVQTGESGLLIDWVMDSSTKLLYENIQDLEKQVAGFDQAEFAKIKASYEQKRAEASKIDQQYGAVNEKIKYLNHRTEKITVVLAELDKAKNYLGMIEQIGHTYSRDGPVATSIRSWALNTIALKTSEYLEMLNTKIHRISLAEKTRDVSITCYSKNTPIDIDSLSGGEQISVSLALRLGMAQLLGTSSLDFMILDEPTTHLDSERRRALVRVLSQLSDISGAHGHLQFIIITHDAEIFDDSAVEKIYKFESTDDGTLVTLL